jgi:WD40 repeat protein
MHALFCLLALGAAPPNGFLRELPGVRRVDFRLRCFALSPDGKTAIGGGQREDVKPMAPQTGAEVRRWDLATGKLLRTWKLAGGDVDDLAISPDGKRVLASVDGPVLCSWDVDGGTIDTVRWNSRVGPRGLSFVDEKNSVALSRERGPVLLDSKGTEKKRLKLPRFLYRGGLFSPDGKMFASATSQDLDLWDTASGKLIRSHLDHDGCVGSLTFRQDGHWLAYLTTLRDENDITRCRVFVRETATGKLVSSIRLKAEFYARDVAVSPDGKLLAVAATVTAHGPGRLFVFDIATGGELARVEYGPGRNWSYGLTFSRNGRTLAVCLNDSIRAYRVGGRR